MDDRCDYCYELFDECTCDDTEWIDDVYPCGCCTCCGCDCWIRNEEDG